LRRALRGLAASDDALWNAATDGHESDTELTGERRAKDDRDLAPLIGMMVALGLSLPFWWALISVLL
jgi:hypothetical protein